MPTNTKTATPPVTAAAKPAGAVDPVQKPASRPDVDRLLVERACEGDGAAFASLYDMFAPQVARRLLRIVGRPDEAEDLLQVTFIEAYRSLPRFDTSRSFRAWLHGISARVVGRHLRAKRRRSWLQLAPDRVADQPDTRSLEAELLQREASRQLLQCMDKLSPKKRIAFALRELEQLDLAEIASMLDTSPQTVWARVQSARKQIKQHLNAMETSAAWHAARGNG